MAGIGEIWEYRGLIKKLAITDLKVRYKNSMLGIVWSMLNPLGMMVILTVVFSQLFRSVEGYPAYVLSGLVAWNFFSQTTSAAKTTAKKAPKKTVEQRRHLPEREPVPEATDEAPVRARPLGFERAPPHRRLPIRVPFTASCVPTRTTPTSSACSPATPRTSATPHPTTPSRICTIRCIRRC